MRTLRSYLEGRWNDGDAPYATLESAITGEAIAQTSSRGLDRGTALAWAREKGGASLRAMTFAERGEVLKALAASIHAARDELLDLSTESYGATRGDGKFDVDGASGTLAWYGSLGKRLGDRPFLLDGEAERLLRSARLIGQHVLVPRRGVAVHINAFNFPAWGMAEKLACSLLAGVPALVKPATATAQVTERIVQLWVEQGLLPEGALSLLCGSAGDLLDHLGPQDAVAFTGSSGTGRIIRSHPKVIAHNIPVNIEADSLNASVLGPDVEPGSDTWEMFAGDLVRDLTQKAGQKCTAIRRVLVPSDRIEALRDALIDRIGDQPVGDPNEKGIRVGPVATRDQHRDVRAGMQTLGEHCSVLVQYGDSIPDNGFFVAPTLFMTDRGTDVPHVHDEEVFGPVATVVSWDGSADEAVRIVARGGGGLVASVYSDDREWSAEVVLGLAPWHGRILWGSRKIADQSPGPGTVLPNLVHGGPGKAGGGEELGGERGLRFYLQRTAIQGDRVLLEQVLGSARD